MKFVIGCRYCFILLFAVLSVQLTAQWSTNPTVNTAVATLANNQTNPKLVSDGSGGAIIAYYDNRSGNYDIYAQKINASGVVQWNSSGVVICTATTFDLFINIVSDGSGGAIITWHDYRVAGNYNIYAQRINASGAIQWTLNGVAICTASNNQFNPTLIGDGSAGAIITWHDYRSGTNYDIYAQRINGSGTVQWTANGVVISNAANHQEYPSIAGDGSAGAIISWRDYRSGTTYDAYAQRINTSGVVQWTANGVSISAASGHQDSPAIVSDSSGGAIMAWSDSRTDANDIYVQKVNSSGVVQWTADGVSLCTAASSQIGPKIISDGSGGAIITWYDLRNGDADIFAQRINAAGTVQFSADGASLCSATGYQWYPAIVSDGSGGAIVTWFDSRSGSNDIYAQKINGSGIVQGTTDGVAICSATGSQDNPEIVTDGSGGAIITWRDQRSGNYDVYAQNYDRYGNISTAAIIDKVGDIANDQGGKMRIFWSPSFRDSGMYGTVRSYTIKLGAKTTGILGKSSEALTSVIYWQTADIVRADQSEGYTTVVKTYADSGLQGIPMYYFQVIAKNNDSSLSWYSNIDSGYSVDNIPPVGVNNAIIASNGEGILLKWDKNRIDKDLMHYGIYRSTTPGFTVGTGTVLTTTSDTTYTDPSGTNGTTYYYRIAAMDVHGNIGAPSNELNETALSLELASFIVSPNRHNADIAWSVATETNSFGYDVERRVAGGAHLEWTRVGFVEGSGTSQLARQYSYTDRNVGNGTYAYRLKQIDRSGQYKFSKTVEVKIGIAPNVFELAQNYPNPFNPSTTIEFTVPSTGKATLKVFNTLGQEVATLYNNEAEAGKYHQAQFNASGLASGIYFAKLSSGGKSQIRKLMLLK